MTDPTTAASDDSRVNHRSWRTRGLESGLEYGILVALVAAFVYFSVTSQYFLTGANLVNIGLAVAVTGVLAAGLTVLLIAGQLDLSIGNTMGLTTTVFAVLTIQHGLTPMLGVGAAVLAGVLVGIFNTVLVVKLGINSIIATLAMGQVLLGITVILPRPPGQNVYLTSHGLQQLLAESFLGIPMPIWTLLAVYLLLYVFLIHTPSGAQTYATGGNPSAAERAGIKTSRIYGRAFLIASLLGVVGGILLVGRSGVGGPSIGTADDTLAALTGVLLGGIGLSGGVGRIERTLAGVLLVGVLQNGMTLINVDSFFQITIRGIVFLLAVVLAAIGSKRRAR